MRRILLVLVSIAGVFAMAGASMGVLSQSEQAAESATPVAAPHVVVLGSVTPDGVDQELVLARVELPPGDDGQSHAHSGTRILYVESGTVRYRLEAGEAWLLRGATGSDRQQLQADPNAWVELGPGDRITESTGASHEYENGGDEPAVVLLWGLYPPNLGGRCGGGCQ